MRHGLKTIPKEPPQKSERRSPDRPEHLLFRGNPSPVSLPSPQSPTSVASSSFLNCALTINLGATRAEGPRDESPGQGSRSGRRPGLNASSLPRPVATQPLSMDAPSPHGSWKEVSPTLSEKSETVSLLSLIFRNHLSARVFVPCVLKTPTFTSIFSLPYLRSQRFLRAEKMSFSPLFSNFFNPISFPTNHFHRNTYRKFFFANLLW